MMPADRQAKYLWDARDAAHRIARFSSDRSLQDLLADDMFRSAVEREFTVIGEALTRIRRLDAALAARIPMLPQIVAFRNILVHAYDSVDPVIIWQTIETDIPQLAALLSTLITETE